MTDKSPEEYAIMIQDAYDKIYEKLHHDSNPIIHSYLIAYNKKLDAVEIFRNIHIKGEIILEKNPIWLGIDADNYIDYPSKITYNENYPETKPDERIILDTIKVISLSEDIVQQVLKIIK
jgi:hypothetical protein